VAPGHGGAAFLDISHDFTMNMMDTAGLVFGADGEVRPRVPNAPLSEGECWEY